MLYRRSTGASCSLGVLAQIAGAVPIEAPADVRIVGPILHWEDIKKEHSPIYDIAPSWLLPEHIREATRLNDTCEKSFDEIADWVEETFCND